MSSELLRFTTAGSVDDGKSTLIGRLLYDSQGVYEDQLAAARRVTRAGSPGALDLSLLTDGLRAEREQGITIDVAYRYFATPRRKFIIADAPGHEQYTRNMATAASGADLAIILIDARHGVVSQSRRHSYIAWLLGIPRTIVAVNKMDRVDFSEEVFDRIKQDFLGYAAKLGKADGIEFIPLSALEGDNVVQRSSRMPWYEGASLLERLETVPLPDVSEGPGLRFPVQYVIRTGDFRGFAGRIASGSIHTGDRITALPSGRQSRVRSIVTWEGEPATAEAPMSVTVCLEDEIDIGRGDMLVHPEREPAMGRSFEATVVWMSERALKPGRAYLLKQGAQTVRARVGASIAHIDIGTLGESTVSSLSLNEIGRAEVEVERPIAFDAYARNRSTGSFILIDPVTNETAAAGMILGAPVEVADRLGSSSAVTQAEREFRNGHRAAVVIVPKEELAIQLERKLFERGLQAFALVENGSGDILRSIVLALARRGAISIVPAPFDCSESGLNLISFQMDTEFSVDSMAERVAREVALR
jgi:sulfate adenylyltransferase large subunit